ncbi:MAG: autotransporter outer membrane beta-barrel domain-containing protein [Acetobacteraceae bacterium]
MLRCESFIGTSAITTETGCAWMELSGGVADQGNGGGDAGFTDGTLNYRFGGQALIAPGWLLGGALGYAHSWLDGDFNTTGEGDAGYVGLSLTRQWQGFGFSGALFGSFGDNSASRTITIPGFQSTLDGHPNVDTEAALLRADYTFGAGRAYIRPSMTVDLVRAHASSFSESGQQTVGLQFGDSATISGVFAPEVEFGLRTDLTGGAALRSYVTLGASLPTTSKFRQSVRLQGAALAAGSFEATIPTDGAAAGDTPVCAAAGRKGGG